MTEQYKQNDTVVTVGYSNKGTTVNPGYQGILAESLESKENKDDILVDFLKEGSMYIPIEALKLVEPSYTEDKVIIYDTDKKIADISKEALLESDIVIVMDNEDPNAARVIKNQYNDVMGLLPNFLVEVLLEDYLSSTVKPEKTNECKSNENREVEEKADEILENLIESLNNLASNPDKVKKQVSAGIDFISSRISSAKDSFSQLDTAFQEAKLVKLLEEANELGVSTKGFTKKVLAKIEEIKK